MCSFFVRSHPVEFQTVTFSRRVKEERLESEFIIERRLNIQFVSSETDDASKRRSEFVSGNKNLQFVSLNKEKFWLTAPDVIIS